MTAIRLVLDATAVAAFPHEAVGETITQVQEDGAAFTTPLAAVVAAAQYGNREMIRYLLGHPAFRPVDIPVTSWRALSVGTELFGVFDVACSLWLADLFDCEVLTSNPKAYAALGADPPIITF